MKAQLDLMSDTRPTQTMIPEPGQAEGLPVRLYYCQKCQTYHRENEELYLEHYRHRNKKQVIIASGY